MERRNFVIGLGGIAASAGLIAGSGAFSQIDAERNMTVQVADDAQAYLALSGGSGDSTFIDETANTIAISFKGYNTATGINDNAISSFDNLVEILNYSDSTVSLAYSITGTNSEGITLYEGSDTTTELGTSSLQAFGSQDSTTSESTDRLEFGVELDSKNYTLDSTADAYTITITATDSA